MSYSTWSTSCVMAPMYNNNIYFVVYNKYTKTPKSYMYALLPPLLPCVKVTEEFHIIRGWGVLICVLIIKTDKTQTWVQTGMRCCVRFPAKTLKVCAIPFATTRGISRSTNLKNKIRFRSLSWMQLFFNTIMTLRYNANLLEVSNFLPHFPGQHFPENMQSLVLSALFRSVQVSSSGKAIDCIVITWEGSPTHQTIQPTTSPWESPYPKQVCVDSPNIRHKSPTPTKKGKSRIFCHILSAAAK